MEIDGGIDLAPTLIWEIMRGARASGQRGRRSKADGEGARGGGRSSVRGEPPRRRRVGRREQRGETGGAIVESWRARNRSATAHAGRRRVLAAHETARVPAHPAEGDGDDGEAELGEMGLTARRRHPIRAAWMGGCIDDEPARSVGGRGARAP